MGPGLRREDEGIFVERNSSTRSEGLSDTNEQERPPGKLQEPGLD